MIRDNLQTSSHNSVRRNSCPEPSFNSTKQHVDNTRNYIPSSSNVSSTSSSLSFNKRLVSIQNTRAIHNRVELLKPDQYLKIKDNVFIYKGKITHPEYNNLKTDVIVNSTNKDLTVSAIFTKDNHKDRIITEEYQKNLPNIDYVELGDVAVTEIDNLMGVAKNIIHAFVPSCTELSYDELADNKKDDINKQLKSAYFNTLKKSYELQAKNISMPFLGIDKFKIPADVSIEAFEAALSKFHNEFTTENLTINFIYFDDETNDQTNKLKNTIYDLSVEYSETEQSTKTQSQISAQMPYTESAENNTITTEIEIIKTLLDNNDMELILEHFKILNSKTEFTKEQYENIYSLCEQTIIKIITEQSAYNKDLLFEINKSLIEISNFFPEKVVALVAFIFQSNINSIFIYNNIDEQNYTEKNNMFDLLSQLAIKSPKELFKLLNKIELHDIIINMLPKQQTANELTDFFATNLASIIHKTKADGLKNAIFQNPDLSYELKFMLAEYLQNPRISKENKSQQSQAIKSQESAAIIKPDGVSYVDNASMPLPNTNIAAEQSEINADSITGIILKINKMLHSGHNIEPAKLKTYYIKVAQHLQLAQLTKEEFQDIYNSFDCIKTKLPNLLEDNEFAFAIMNPILAYITPYHPDKISKFLMDILKNNKTCLISWDIYNNKIANNTLSLLSNLADYAPTEVFEIFCKTKILKRLAKTLYTGNTSEAKAVYFAKKLSSIINKVNETNLLDYFFENHRFSNKFKYLLAETLRKKYQITTKPQYINSLKYTLGLNKLNTSNTLQQLNYIPAVKNNTTPLTFKSSFNSAMRPPLTAPIATHTDSIPAKQHVAEKTQQSNMRPLTAPIVTDTEAIVTEQHITETNKDVIREDTLEQLKYLTNLQINEDLVVNLDTTQVSLINRIGDEMYGPFMRDCITEIVNEMYYDEDPRQLIRLRLSGIPDILEKILESQYMQNIQDRFDVARRIEPPTRESIRKEKIERLYQIPHIPTGYFSPPISLVKTGFLVINKNGKKTINNNASVRDCVREITEAIYRYEDPGSTIHFGDHVTAGSNLFREILMSSYIQGIKDSFNDAQ